MLLFGKSEAIVLSGVIQRNRNNRMYRYTGIDVYVNVQIEIDRRRFFQSKSKVLRIRGLIGQVPV